MVGARVQRSSRARESSSRGVIPISERPPRVWLGCRVCGSSVALAAALVFLVAGSSAQAHAGHASRDQIELQKSATAILVTPGVSVALAPVAQSALPRDALTYPARVTNSQDIVQIAGDLVASNDTRQSETVASWYDAIVTNSTRRDWERHLSESADPMSRKRWGTWNGSIVWNAAAGLMWSSGSGVRDGDGKSGGGMGYAFAATGEGAAGYSPVDPVPSAPVLLGLETTPVPAKGWLTAREAGSSGPCWRRGP